MKELCRNTFIPTFSKRFACEGLPRLSAQRGLLFPGLFQLLITECSWWTKTKVPIPGWQHLPVDGSRGSVAPGPSTFSGNKAMKGRPLTSGNGFGNGRYVGSPLSGVTCD